ncbi:MAG: hypothetical protein WBQ50_21930 [Nocardioides sp.]
MWQRVDVSLDNLTVTHRPGTSVFDVSNVSVDHDEDALVSVDVGEGGRLARVQPPSCTAAGSRLSCRVPTSGAFPTFTIIPDVPTSPADVQLTASAAAGSHDTDSSNDSHRQVLVVPGAILESARGTQDGDEVIAQFRGVPFGWLGIRELKITMRGLNGEPATAQFVGGVNGATGEGTVDCEVSSETVVTCTNIRGDFLVNMNVQLAPGSSEKVILLAEVVGLGGVTIHANDLEPTLTRPAQE